jgi:hypothetical protein
MNLKLSVQIFFFFLKKAGRFGNGEDKIPRERICFSKLSVLSTESKEMREDGGQRTEDRGQRTEDRGQRTEDRGQRTEDRGQRTEDRGQRTEGRGQRAEGRGQRTEDRGQRTEGRGQRTEDRGQRTWRRTKDEGRRRGRESLPSVKTRKLIILTRAFPWAAIVVPSKSLMPVWFTLKNAL